MAYLQIQPFAKVTAWIPYGVSADTAFCQSTVTECERVSADTPFLPSEIRHMKYCNALAKGCIYIKVIIMKEISY